MPIIKPTRASLVLLLACTTVSTLLLVHFLSSTRWATPLFSFTDLKSANEAPLTDYHDISFPFNIDEEQNTTLPVDVESGVSQAAALPRIRNNNASYPRTQHRTSQQELVESARKQLDRLHSARHLLFDGAMHLNEEMFKRLEDHLRTAESGQHYIPPIVVLTSWHWVPCAMGPCTTGEVQWIRPLIEVMKKHGIIYLFSPWDRFHEDWELLGNDLVTHVWADDEHVVWCFAEPDRCLTTVKNPTGIPPWKLFSFTFWGSKPNSAKWGSKSEPFSFNPLGPEWNLVPYQMPERQFFIGYHYQGCQALHYIPFEQRQDQMIVLAKRSSYYHGQGHVFDPESFFVNLRSQTGFDIISNADQEQGFPIPEGLRSIGLMPQEEYDILLANSKALLGVGRPMISPTPYASLCRGVPVIIPYNSQIILPHSNKTCPAQPGPGEWCGFLEESHQHGPASSIGPPYVYTVDINAPTEEILRTIKTAIKTPIKPYEPPEMRKEAVEQRLLDYFTVDWQAYAQERLKERGSDELTLPVFLQSWAENNRDPTALASNLIASKHRRRRLRKTY